MKVLNKPEEKGLIGRRRLKWENKITMNLTERIRGSVDSINVV